MGNGKSTAEVRYALNQLERKMVALRYDPALVTRFTVFASQRLGTTPERLRPRIYHLSHGRLPTTPLVLVLNEFFEAGHASGYLLVRRNAVDYYTPSGQVDELEQWVCRHPLDYRIAWVHVRTDRKTRLVVGLRAPRELTLELMKTGNSEPLHEPFYRWLATQPELPRTVEWEKQSLPVEYWPQWCHSMPSWELDSANKCTTDVGFACAILVICHLKSPLGWDLDLAYAIEKYTGDRCTGNDSATFWLENLHLLPEAFYRYPQLFGEPLRSKLEQAFANLHRQFARSVRAAQRELDRQDVEWDPEAPNIKTVEMSERIAQAFQTWVTPILEKHRAEMDQTIQRMVLQEQRRNGLRSFNPEKN